MDMKLRGKRLRKLREAQGLTISGLQMEVLRAGVPITEATLRGWELGGNPTALPLMAVLMVIGDDAQRMAAGLILEEFYEKTGEDS